MSGHALPRHAHREDNDMATVHDILRTKGWTVYRVPENATVHEAIAEMVRRDIGALVVGEGPEPSGLFTERDYLRRVLLEDHMPRTTPVGSVAAQRVACVTPETSVDQCMQIMTERRVRHLPVLHGTRLVGIVSIGDIVKWLMIDQAMFIRSLTDYIQGRA
jgi:CBS domain-containing protein